MNSGKLIDSFLNNIGVKEKTKEQYNGSLFFYEINKENKNISIKIETTGKKNPATNFDIFKNVYDTFINKGLNVNSFIIKKNIENDIIEIYENIVYFFKKNNASIDYSKFKIKLDGEFHTIIVGDRPTLEVMNQHIQDINKFLLIFSVIDQSLLIKMDAQEMKVEKLEEAMDNLNIEVEEFILEEKNDEKIWPSHSKVDISKEEEQTKVYFEGIVVGEDGFNSDIVEKRTKNGRRVINFTLGNGNEAVEVSVFLNENDKSLNIKAKDALRVYGKYSFNDFNQTYNFAIFSSTSVQKISPSVVGEIVSDETEYERNEFHVHTKMSVIDGVSNPKDYVKVAEAYKIKTLTITDHNSTQSFPDAAKANNDKVKFNYGVEFDVYDDLFTKVVINERPQALIDAEYVVFDLETTSISAFANEIIEFGAVKYKNNTIIDRKQLFIRPKIKISEFTTELTGITNEDVENAPFLSQAIKEIKDWIGDSILVAHNAYFDFNFLNKAYIDNGLGQLPNPVIDTMKLSWLIHPNSRNHRLGTLAKHEFVEYDTVAAHRADYDAQVLSGILERLIHKLSNNENIRDLMELNKIFPRIKDYYFGQHIVAISKNQTGLKDLNRMVSDASITYFNEKRKQPRLPLSYFFIEENTKNVLLGSACGSGLLFQAVLDADWPKVKQLVRLYDYIEIFPPTSYANLLTTGKLTEEQLNNVLKKIIQIAKENDILVIASSNAHYATKKEKVFRDVLINAPRVGNSFHPLVNFSNRSAENPNAHLRSTTEMFEEFEKIMSHDEAKKIIIDNPKILQSMIEEGQSPVHKKLYPPKIDGVDEKFESKIQENLKKTYGDDIDPRIIERINKEKDSIVKHGYAIIYYLSGLAVQKSMDEGFLVGSRGSVGSSLAATMSGITEVNPLAPHYICDKCKYHEFVEGYGSGYDLPNADCPVCGSAMRGEGHNIPFETFLGFSADKVPDIDLNFSRENQSSIHLYIKEVLGEDKVFRAGTISTAAFKTSMGFVRKYFEDTNRQFTKAQVEWISANVEGAKRTTGQHPGGLIVIPNDMDVYDFSAIQYPGDDSSADWKTTHFDFHSIHDNLLKLDLLGHLDPSSIRMLQTLTKIDPQSIPMNDPKVISLFASNDALNFIENFTGDELGIMGIPEFGTNFVRELVKDAKPKSFADLVRVSGLSHGTDVWAGNAQKLIKDKVANLAEVISVRDDIMTYLISYGLDNLMSFQIMESVRKGLGLKEEWESEMISKGVPEWYINSCKLIKYMFPKAHATAYVIMAYRIAWYKINYPLEYYATFFSKRDVEIELEKVNKGINEMKRHLQEIKKLSRWERTKKDNDIAETYNIIFEMYSRGYKMETIDVNKSGSTEYIIDHENKSLIPPLVIVEGIGDAVAEKFVQVRNSSPYISIVDFKARSGVSKTAIDIIKKLNGFGDLPENSGSTNQLNLFG